MESLDVAQIAADTTDPRAGLRAVASLRTLADALELRQVEAALRSGMSWQAIADAWASPARQCTRSTRSGSIRHRRSPEELMSRFTHAAATMHTLVAGRHGGGLTLRSARRRHRSPAPRPDHRPRHGEGRSCAAWAPVSMRPARRSRHSMQLNSSSWASPQTPTVSSHRLPRDLGIRVDGTGARCPEGSIERGSARRLRCGAAHPHRRTERSHPGDLRRIDVDPEILSARLDEVQRLRLVPLQAPDTHTLSGTRSLFAPASREDVWALLSSAGRIPEWDPAVGTIHADHDTTGPWEAESTTEAPDGRPVRVKEEFRRQRVELVECEKPDLIRWRFSYPGRRPIESEARRLRTRTCRWWNADPRDPHVGATQRRGGQRLVRALLKPLHRLLVSRSSRRSRVGSPASSVDPPTPMAGAPRGCARRDRIRSALRALARLDELGRGVLLPLRSSLLLERELRRLLAVATLDGLSGHDYSLPLRWLA